MRSRTEKEMLDLILSIAVQDDRIRAVTLTGSRVYPNVKSDCFQDFDVSYVVTDVNPFIKDKTWINLFGEIMIMDTLDRMEWQQNERYYIYLMQFTDALMLLKEYGVMNWLMQKNFMIVMFVHGL